MNDIILNSDHSTSINGIVVNQYENAHDSYRIVIPDGMTNSIVYVIGSIKYRAPDKEKYSISMIDICPDSIWTIYNKFTAYNGIWEIHFMLCSQEIDIEESPIDLSELTTSMVYISDPIQLVVKKVTSYDGFEIPEVSEGWTDAFNKIVTVYEEIKNAYEDGLLKGEPGIKGYTPIKGLDYFTDQEINNIKNDIISTTNSCEVVGTRLIIGGINNG